MYTLTIIILGFIMKKTTHKQLSTIITRQKSDKFFYILVYTNQYEIQVQNGSTLYRIYWYRLPLSLCVCDYVCTCLYMCE